MGADMIFLLPKLPVKERKEIINISMALNIIKQFKDMNKVINTIEIKRNEVMVHSLQR